MEEDFLFLDWNGRQRQGTSFEGLVWFWLLLRCNTNVCFALEFTGTAAVLFQVDFLIQYFSTRQTFDYFSQETLWAKCLMLSSQYVGAITVASIFLFLSLENKMLKQCANPWILKIYLNSNWSGLNSFFSLAANAILSCSGVMKGLRQAYAFFFS